MANPEHVERLVDSTAEEWNAWRMANPDVLPDVSDAAIGRLRTDNGFVTEGGQADFEGFALASADLTGARFEGADLSRADLQYANMCNANLSRVSFYDVKMKKLNLSDSELHECVFLQLDLSKSDFTDASIVDCYFNNVNLRKANLNRAEFSGSSLRGVNFEGCDLSLTKLIGTRLSCSALHRAEIIHDLDPIQPERNLVKAGLADSVGNASSMVCQNLIDIVRGRNSSESKDRIGSHTAEIDNPCNRTTKTIESVQDMFDRLDEELINYESLFTPMRYRVYYRGVGCVRWRVQSSLDQRELRGEEPELLKDLTIIEPDEFNEAKSTLDQLVLARHHSLPARLLDVTRNPLVALFFACREIDPCERTSGHESCNRNGKVHMFVTPAEMVRPYDSDTVSVLAALSQLDQVDEDILLTKCPAEPSWAGPITTPHTNHDLPAYRDVMQRLVHFVARDKPYFRNAVDPRDFFRVLVVEPRRAFTRVRAQSGAFLLSGFHHEFDAGKVKANGPKIPIYNQYTFEIPRDAKDDIMRQLAYAQIDEVTMMPGLEPVARSIAERYEGR